MKPVVDMLRLVVKDAARTKFSHFPHRPHKVDGARKTRQDSISYKQIEAQEVIPFLVLETIRNKTDTCKLKEVQNDILHVKTKFFKTDPQVYAKILYLILMYLKPK